MASTSSLGIGDASGEARMVQLYVNGPRYNPFKEFKRLDDANLCVISLPKAYQLPFAVSWRDIDTRSLVAVQAFQGLCLLLRVYSDDTLARGDSNVTPIIETVPAADGREDAGLRVWFYCTDTTWCPGDVVEDMNAAGTERMVKRMRKGLASRGNGRLLAEGNSETRDEYLRLCSAIVNRKNYCDVSKCRDEELRSMDNPANPLRVFSLKRAMSAIPGADRRFTRIQNYFSRVGHVRKYRFPDPKRCYRLSREQIVPEVFLSYFLPHVRASPNDVDVDKQLVNRQTAAWRETDPTIRPLYRRDEGEDEDEDDEDGDAKMPALPLSELPSRGDTYKYTVQQLASVDVLATPEQQARRNLSSLNKLRAEFSDLVTRRSAPSTIDAALEQLRGKRDELWTVGLAAFRMWWTPHAPAMSKELKRVVLFGQNRLMEKPEFSDGVRPTLTRNLPMAADWVLRQSINGEWVHYIHIAHDAFIVVLLSQFDAYCPSRDDKLHYCGAGHPGAAKSYVLHKGKKMFIDGTVEPYTHQSKHARSAASNGNSDHKIEQCHEFNNDKLGITQVARGSKAKGTGSDDENFFKSVLDTGKWVTLSMGFNPITHKREPVELDIKYNFTTQGNTNMSARRFAPAIRDRFFVMQFRNYARADKEMLETMAITPTSEAKRLEQASCEDTWCDQYLFALTGQLIAVHLLNVVGTSMARRLVTMILLRAIELGMPKLQSPRVILRITRIMVVLTILNAIQTVFHSDLSPCRGRPWQLDDMKYLKPMLRVTHQEMIFALGLMKNSELNNPLYILIIRTLEARYFPTTNNSQKARPPIVTSTTTTADGKSSTEEYTVDGEHQDKKQALKPYYYVPTTMHQQHSFASTGAQQQSAEGKAPAEPMASTQTNEVQDYVEAKNLYAFENRLRGKEKPGTAAAPAPPAQPPAVPPAVSGGGGGGSGGSSGQFLPPSERRLRLARILRLEMIPRPDEGELVDALFDMESHTAKSIREDGKDIMLFELTETGFRLATSALLTQTEDPLEQAIHDVLEHDKTVEQEYLYEFKKGDAKHLPYLPTTIRIKRKVDRPFVLSEPTFLDEKQRQLLGDLSLRDDPQARIDLDKIFERLQETPIERDLDLDDWEQHAHYECMWTQKELKDAHFGSAAAMKQMALKRAEERLAKANKRVLVYPQDFQQQGRKSKKIAAAMARDESDPLPDTTIIGDRLQTSNAQPSPEEEKYNSPPPRHRNAAHAKAPPTPMIVD